MKEIRAIDLSIETENEPKCLTSGGFPFCDPIYID